MFIYDVMYPLSATIKLKILLLQLLLKIMQKAIEEESKGDSERLPAYMTKSVPPALIFLIIEMKI